MKTTLINVSLALLLCAASVCTAADPAPVTTKPETFTGLLKYSQVEMSSAFSQAFLGANAKMLVDKYELQFSKDNKPITAQIFAVDDKITSQFQTLKGKQVRISGAFDLKDSTIRNVTQIQEISEPTRK